MYKSLQKISYSLDTLAAVAAEFSSLMDDNRIFAFSGQLGAGKTTFIHILCEELGVSDAVSSPTFALINEYHFNDKQGKENVIFHMDWYRLKSEDEAISTGMEDCLLQKDAYCFIEWPEKASSLLQMKHILLKINNLGDTEREMEILSYE